MAILECMSMGCIPIAVKISQLEHLFEYLPELAYLDKNFTETDISAIIESYEKSSKKTFILKEKMTAYLKDFHMKENYNALIEKLVIENIKH